MLKAQIFKIKRYIKSVKFIANIYYKIKLFWNRLWIRKNEFRKSLEFDIEVFELMDKKEKELYILDLIRRRNIAHNIDIKKEKGK